MKIIHTADIHLDSKMRANLDADKARERKHEILNTFLNMVKYASDNDIGCIMISGDLFDTRKISSLVMNSVENVIINNPSIDFYYLKGNHDNMAIFNEENKIPDNLHLFTGDWTKYTIGENTDIWGLEPLGENSASLQASFAPDPGRINIVMLHGQISEGASQKDVENININNYKNKGVNYLALGHVHEYRIINLDSSNSFLCYPGCLEGRGFDEIGEHGFVVIDVDEKSGLINPEFIPFAKRRMHNLILDVTDAGNSAEIIEKGRRLIAESDVRTCDLIKVTLCGSVDPDMDIDTEYIRHSLEDNFYFLKVKDESVVKIKYEDYLLDESLKGEFVRLVMNSDLDEQEKGEIIRYGIGAIRGGIE